MCKTRKIIFKDEAAFCGIEYYFIFVFKQMFDTVVALDGRPIDFKIFQSSLGLFIFCLR